MRSAPKPDDDRKRTEELLAGFDRTGRTPQAPRVHRDFVDYHRPSANDGVRPAKPEAAPTFVIRKQRSAVPSWAPWAAVVVMMLAGGSLVAWLVTPARSPVPAPPRQVTVTPAPQPLAPVSVPTATSEPPSSPPATPPESPSASAPASARPKPPAPKAGGFVRTL